MRIVSRAGSGARNRADRGSLATGRDGSDSRTAGRACGDSSHCPAGAVPAMVNTTAGDNRRQPGPAIGGVVNGGSYLRFRHLRQQTCQREEYYCRVA